MRIYRVETDDGLQYVVENGDRVFHLIGDLFDSWEIGPELLRGLEDLKIVAPVVPSKIFTPARPCSGMIRMSSKPSSFMSTNLRPLSRPLASTIAVC